uniref:global nitrogen transcriptional regulator n=1 Tax=Synarthrophyton patena TaxID=48972 RepID=UPI0021824732|nr:global nitrogen transcriptional regulator [Synarthrophyton patena]UVF62861.1 global nitrogen transcriptional regulator [Synarthrophyton patena]
MIWLDYLESIDISFNIEILQTHDSIIITNKAQNNQMAIILDGFIKIIKVFTNREIICTQLLKVNNIIQLHNSKNKLVNYYYKASAITETVILSIPIKELTKKKINTQSLIKIFEQLNTHYRISNNRMLEILCHKNTKKRILQLLLILSKEFGQIKKQKIIIPLFLPHSILSTITGCHRVNIAKIMNELKNKNLISYNNKQLIIYNILKLSQY